MAERPLRIATWPGGFFIYFSCMNPFFTLQTITGKALVAKAAVVNVSKELDYTIVCLNVLRNDYADGAAYNVIHQTRLSVDEVTRLIQAED